jgi:hypothetical protein
MDVEPITYTKTYQTKMCDGRWSSVELGMATRFLDNGDTIILSLLPLPHPCVVPCFNCYNP